MTTAMAHLEDLGLRVGSLGCSDALLHLSGQVKLGMPGAEKIAQRSSNPENGR